MILKLDEFNPKNKIIWKKDGEKR
jgi:hypothetical protein